MFYTDMNEAQRTELALFEERLLDAGWDIEPVATLLHTGTWVSPEGSADLLSSLVELSADFYADDRVIHLIIENADRRVRFRLLLADSIEPVLSWLTASQKELDPLNFPRYLATLIPLCREVLYLTSDGKPYRLSLEDLENSPLHLLD